MQHMLAPYSRKSPPFAWWDGAFTNEELDWLQQKAKEATQEALVCGDKLDTAHRRTKLNWLYSCAENKWLYEKLSDVAARLNADHYGFDLTGFGEALQMTNYSSEDQGEYKWHQDSGSNGPCRKLSLVLQLSEPQDYEGGNLEILTSIDPKVVEKKRGLLAVFPSWTLHQVTPVISGSRQTLVAWISGPDFK